MRDYYRGAIRDEMRDLKSILHIQFQYKLSDLDKMSLDTLRQEFEKVFDDKLR